MSYYKMYVVDFLVWYIWKLTNVIANEWGILHESTYTHKNDFDAAGAFPT